MGALLAGIAVSSVIFPSAAYAGHQYGGGDCWQYGTPLTCRVSWASGDHHHVYLRVINQLSNSTLWNAAVTGCSHWNGSPGPQYCHTTPYTNDSWVYFKRNDQIGAPNGVTYNCNVNGYCSDVIQAMNIYWTEIYEPKDNTNYASVLVPIAAHELGHALALAHHGAPGSNVALMTQGTTRTYPNSIDIGPQPPCSGASGASGVRCIYNGTL
jgi:hypothetical protein